IRYCLANFAFLSQKDNRTIKDKSPLEYKNDIASGFIDSVFTAAYIPIGGLDMEYEEFLDKRAELLREAAKSLV
ncbi:hypothetical protein Q4R43_18160, partial [Morganella morganii]